MQSATYVQEKPAVILRSMTLVAIASFVAGFGGYLVLGLTLIG